MVNSNPDPSGRTRRLVLAIAAGLALLWTGGIALAPWLAAHDSVFGGLLRLAYRPSCHQIPDRCLDLGFGPLAVCARCAGLYLGGTLGLLWTALRNQPCRPRPLLLAVVAAPSVLDFVAGQLGLPSVGNWTRFAIASPAGLLVGLFLGDALIDIARLNSRSNLESSEMDPVE